MCGVDELVELGEDLFAFNRYQGTTSRLESSYAGLTSVASKHRRAH